LACPFFMPTHRADDAGWPHPSRLPLGAGWNGVCRAPGHEPAEPSQPALQQLCNLGYATGCSRLPKERTADAVRFSVARDRGSQLELWFVCERGHRPADYGKLDYDRASGRWSSRHPDAGIQKMAECYLEAYLLRRIPCPPADAPPPMSPHP
jgi:hypothetical protein